MKKDILSSLTDLFGKIAKIFEPAPPSPHKHDCDRRTKQAALFHVIMSDNALTPENLGEFAKAMQAKPHLLDKSFFNLSHELFACPWLAVQVGTEHAAAKIKSYETGMAKYAKNATEDQIETNFKNFQLLISLHLATDAKSARKVLTDHPELIT